MEGWTIRPFPIKKEDNILLSPSPWLNGGTIDSFVNIKKCTVCDANCVCYMHIL
jgi:hypothetical protein